MIPYDDIAPTRDGNVFCKFEVWAGPAQSIYGGFPFSVWLRNGDRAHITVTELWGDWAWEEKA